MMNPLQLYRTRQRLCEELENAYFMRAASATADSEEERLRIVNINYQRANHFERLARFPYILFRTTHSLGVELSRI